MAYMALILQPMGRGTVDMERRGQESQREVRRQGETKGKEMDWQKQRQSQRERKRKNPKERWRDRE